MSPSEARARRRRHARGETNGDGRSLERGEPTANGGADSGSRRHLPVPPTIVRPEFLEPSDLGLERVVNLPLATGAYRTAAYVARVEHLNVVLPRMSFLTLTRKTGDHVSCCSRVASSRCSSGLCSSASRRSRSPIRPTLPGSRATGMMAILTTLSSPSLPRPPSRNRHSSMPSSRYGCLSRASRCRNKKPTERRVAPPPLLVLLP